MIELTNNEGVVKFPTKPAALDPKAIAKVRIDLKIPCQGPLDWRTGSALDPAQIAIGPGETVFVELVTDG